EAGRALAPGPLVATMVGARLAAVAGESALSEQIAAGDGPVAAAIVAAADQLPADLLLVDATSATHVLVLAAGRADLYPVASLVGLEDRRSIDEAARLSCGRVDGPPVATAQGNAAHDLALRASVLTAALLAGVSAGVRDMAVRHATLREQFGAPIGVHQAVKHKCADMAVRTEAAECLVLFAALAVDEGRADAEALVAAARVIASDAALRGARDNIQIHGGMGFTDDSDAHLYLKRAHLLDRMFGTPAAHRRVLVAS
ncbi:MAG TPA: acyl-CoA dehydrogenase family protein, partial [Mycobacteriales bacterium]|nr:acyl-CoA dehydrogenase family protein [Mycobacteriales bacterium]